MLCDCGGAHPFCDRCGGTGIAHCCEGERAQPWSMDYAPGSAVYGDAVDSNTASTPSADRHRDRRGADLLGAELSGADRAGERGVEQPVDGPGAGDVIGNSSTGMDSEEPDSEEPDSEELGGDLREQA